MPAQHGGEPRGALPIEPVAGRWIRIVAVQPFVGRKELAMSTKGKILLVDDDVDFVRSTADLLEAHGYNVTWAHNGASGLEMARKERPDLMVLDVMMATKTEGFEVARKIPSCPELRDMSVLLVTGIRGEMQLEFRLEPDETWLPVSRVMEKPIEPAGFIAAVGELLRRREEMDWQHGAPRLVKGLLAGKETDLWTIPPQASVYEVVEMMEHNRVGALPVIENGKLVGICTKSDCARSAILRNCSPKTTPVREIMTARVLCVSPIDTMEDCASLMIHKRVRYLPVLDGGKLVGIVSLGDVVRSALAEKNFTIEQLESYIMTG
jgi:CBS domain-containing protein/CheY-like chemotaxis protein